MEMTKSVNILCISIASKKYHEGVIVFISDNFNLNINKMINITSDIT